MPRKHPKRQWAPLKFESAQPVEPAAVEPAAVEPAAVEPAAVGPPMVGPAPVGPAPLERWLEVAKAASQQPAGKQLASKWAATPDAVPADVDPTRLQPPKSPPAEPAKAWRPHRWPKLGRDAAGASDPTSYWSSRAVACETSRGVRPTTSWSYSPAPWAQSPPATPPAEDTSSSPLPAGCRPPRELTYASLIMATDGFNSGRLLGSGGAGSVFKADFDDSDSPLAGKVGAVKVIDTHRSDPNVAGFEEEVKILRRVRHPNIVALRGWAMHRSFRCLVYEFMDGSDAQARLKRCKEGAKGFPWHERLRLATDMAAGLAFLHNSEPRVFHRDIKPANVLMDTTGPAKIADFGMALLVEQPDKRCVRCKSIGGTKGYICPEYRRTSLFKESSDVYSYGASLLQLLTNITPRMTRHGAETVERLTHKVKPDAAGALDRAMENGDRNAGWPSDVRQGIAEIGLRCVTSREEKRPCMNDICQELSSLLPLPRPEPPPAEAPPVQEQQKPEELASGSTPAQCSPRMEVIMAWGPSGSANSLAAFLAAAGPGMLVRPDKGEVRRIRQQM